MVLMATNAFGSFPRFRVALISKFVVAVDGFVTTLPKLAAY
jgi:hypothetical protein